MLGTALPVQVNGVQMVSFLPPMNALSPFIETARLGTTTAAAERLNRSHGAVCRQIKLLEERLEVSLFHRVQGRLTLTESGRKYFESVSKALASLERASLELKRGNDTKVLRVACPTAFAKRWLLPRLDKFCERNRSVDLYLVDWFESSSRPLQFDIAILTSPLEEPHLDIDPLMPDLIFPVRSGNIVRGCTREENHTLIRTPDLIASWSNWPGSPESRATRQYLNIEDTDVAISAAALGRGLHMARGQLVMDELASGKLGMYGEMVRQIDTAYWLMQPSVTERGPSVRAFSSFIRSEAILAFDELKRRIPSVIARVA
jgi:LysR family glycine cleavage system transcriptional activator